MADGARHRLTETRAPLPHVILIDGTFASLNPGRTSSVGQIYAALTGSWGKPPQHMRVRYLPGMQWERWHTLPDLIVGAELENRIRAAYRWLSRGWRPGDPIYLFGYSRGAFAVRSLAGMIGQVGLLRNDRLSDERVNQAWQLYRMRIAGEELDGFTSEYCLRDVPIRMIGVFDTVMALGVRLPLLWQLTEPRFRFHDQKLGDHVGLGVQALALDETRAAFSPILWSSDHAHDRIRQMWFRGAHPDIGGQLSGMEYARPLANIPLVWMMHQAAETGLPLPPNWSARLFRDASAPPVGSWHGWGKAFMARTPRIAGTDPSEDLHRSVPRPYLGPAILTGSLASEAARPRPRASAVRQPG